MKGFILFENKSYTVYGTIDELPKNLRFLVESADYQKKVTDYKEDLSAENAMGSYIGFLAGEIGDDFEVRNSYCSLIGYFGELDLSAVDMWGNSIVIDGVTIEVSEI